MMLDEIIISGLSLEAPLIFHSTDVCKVRPILIDVHIGLDVRNYGSIFCYSSLATYVVDLTKNIKDAPLSIFDYGETLIKAIIQHYQLSESQKEFFIRVRVKLSKISLEADDIFVRFVTKHEKDHLVIHKQLIIHELITKTTIGIHSWEKETLQRIKLNLQLDLPENFPQSFPISMFLKFLIFNIEHHQEEYIESLAEWILSYIFTYYVVYRGEIYLEKVSALPKTNSVGVKLFRAIDCPDHQYRKRHVFLAFGSNIGNRAENIYKALNLLKNSSEALSIISSSLMYETKPMYYLEQDLFLNCVCQIETSLTPLELLSLTQFIESTLKRVKVINKGPRVIDIDILFYGDLVFQTDALTIPHPRLREREFVLRPLFDIKPDFKHPIHHLSIRDMLYLLLREKEGFKSMDIISNDFPYIDVAPALCIRDRVLPWKGSHAHALIMGILNVTPDSFSDGGLYHNNVNAAVERALQMIQEGADMIDVGGVSTRPGAEEISIEEEMQRVIPVLKAIRENNKEILLSIDTYHPEVAEAAIKAANVDILNDITAERLCATAKKHNMPIILMHMRGMPNNMNSYIHSYNNYDSDDCIKDIAKDMMETVLRCQANGMYRWNLILDPGIGFAKDKDQNLAIFRHFKDMEPFSQYPTLIGPSRKKFIGDLEAIPYSSTKGVHNRVFATIAACSAAVQKRVTILRVHDVNEVKAAAILLNAMYKY